jgi:hypothetical protein
MHFTTIWLNNGMLACINLSRWYPRTCKRTHQFIVNDYCVYIRDRWRIPDAWYIQWLLTIIECTQTHKAQVLHFFYYSGHDVHHFVQPLLSFDWNRILYKMVISFVCFVCFPNSMLKCHQVTIVWGRFLCSCISGSPGERFLFCGAFILVVPSCSLVAQFIYCNFAHLQ